MLPVSRRLPALAAALAAAVAARAQETRADLDARFARDARPLFVAYCGKCHGADEPKGDLDLVRFASAETLRGDFRPWLDVVDLLASGEMPPAKAPQPSADERQRMVAIVREVLADHARAHAGDPGPVTLRRLDNAQYRYAVQDLTGLDALDPTREFPADGAAGEGFTNVGQALAMSPTLAQKHLAAAKEVAAHAALLPDGLRFLRGTTRRDQTDELVAAIRAFHRRHTDSRGSNVVHVQGHAFTTDVGGRLPAGRYLEAALALRASAVVDDAAVCAVAARHGLSPKYLGILWRALVDGPPSALLDALRARWRAAAAGDGEALAQWLASWQQRLFAFRNVGHIGKVGGPKAWMEPVSAAVEELALRLPATAPKDGHEANAVVVAVAVAGTGPARVALRQPRLVRAGRRDLLLRDVPAVADALASRRVAVAATAAQCLQAADAVLRQGVDRAAAASAAGVDVAVLAGWLELLGGSAAPSASLPLLDGPIRDASGHAEVRGWGGKDLPSVFANASASELRIPGTMAPHGFAVHPTPAQRAVVAWQSPLSARVRVAATVQRAHMACGNGVDWELRLHRGAAALLLASGVADDAVLDRAEELDFDAERGDVLALSVGPRAQDHRCDLTAVDLVVTAADGARFELAADVAPDVLRGNPHPGRDGAPGVWRFAGEPRELQGELAHAQSTLGQWLLAPDAAQRAQLAERLQRMVAGALAPATAADASMLELVGSVDGPLLRTCLDVVCVDASVGPDLVVDAPGVLTLRAPAELAAGAEWAATAQIAAGSAPDAAAQVALAADAAQPAAPMLLDAPFLVGSAAGRARVDAACAAFRALFPAALCYQQVVPIDEAVTLTQFHREDEPLRRLVLDDAAVAELDRMWRELHFVAQDALTAVDAFEQIWQYATQDADPSAFEPLRAPILARAAAFRGELLAAEPRHLDAVLALADRAWRRPLRAEEQQGLRALYASLRAEGLGHDDAVRLLLARVLASPAFLYRAEDAVSGAAWGAVGAEALANRLSFFLAASVPDAALRADAASGALLDPEALVAHGRRLLAAGGARRLAVEFGTSWLHLRDFADQAEKSERLFPGFRALRGSMHEEVVRFLADWFERDGSVHELLDADHTFVDNALAAHYGLPTAATDGWRRVDGLRALGRGGLLGMAAVLASQSGASRTSPILRGNWIAEALLGDRLPKPPKDVPRLPEEEDGQSLTMRELTERHRRDPACAHCHDRIDPYGLALEAFDFVGRRRIADLGGRALDLRVATKDGAQFADLAGLRDHLLQRRRDAFEEQFLRKLLGYALGRSVLLTDQPLLDAIRAEWPQHGHRVGFALASILKSPQFRCVRGSEWTER